MELARRLLETADTGAWAWELGPVEPSKLDTESMGKLPRFWIVGVRYRRDGAVMDGPGLIRVDLKLELASWP